MKLSSANILKEGHGEIRPIGSTCDPACAMWSFCQNSVPDGSCKGFLLMNGKSQNLLNRTLNEDDKIYIQNCVHRIQNGSNEEGLVREVLRFIPHEESQRKEGFIGMLECARGIPTTPTQESEPIERASDRTESREHGFIAMFTASQKRSLDEFPQICTKQCPHTQCSSWGTSAMENQPCRNRVLTNEEVKHSETRTVDNAENSAKLTCLVPNRPNFCKPKNPNGLDEE